MEKENNIKNDFSRQQTKNIQQTTKDQRPSQEAQPPSKEDKNQPQKTPQNYTSKTILQNNEPHHTICNSRDPTKRHSENERP